MATIAAACSGLQNPATFEADEERDLAPREAYVIGGPPAGYELCGVSVPSSLSLRPEVGPTLLVYGDGSLSDPYTGPLVGVALFDAAGLDELALGPVEEVTVQGQRALLGSIAGLQLADLGAGLGQALTWAPADGRIVQLVVRGSGDLDIVGLATAVRISGDIARLDLAALPAGFVDLGNVYELEGRAQFRFSLDYQRLEPGSEDALTLLGSVGGVEAMDAFRFRASSSERVSVAGMPGVAADIGPGGEGPWVVVWAGADELLLRLFSFRIPAVELVDVAATVETVDGDAWAAILDAHDPPTCGR